LGTEEVTSTMYTDVVDLGNKNPKHIYYIDVVGDWTSFGNSSFLSVSWGKDRDASDISTTAGINNLEENEPFRVRNLGRFRQVTFRVQLTGSTHFVMDRIDMAYNLGRY
ncbi:MAG: hypothetical protein ACRDBG_05665, partial [Waterburya sp.]